MEGRSVNLAQSRRNFKPISALGFSHYYISCNSTEVVRKHFVALSPIPPPPFQPKRLAVSTVLVRRTRNWFRMIDDTKMHCDNPTLVACSNSIQGNINPVWFSLTRY